MRHLLLAVAFAALPNLALAKMGGAVCRTGQGCTCFDVTDSGLFPVLLGDTALGTISLTENLVIDRSTNTIFRTTRALDEVHRSFGGQGECPMDPERAELIPLAGTWQWRTRNETTTGCPPMMAAALAASRPETISTRVIWEDGFDPRELAASLPQPEAMEMSPYEWRELAPNRWFSDNIRSRSCEDGTCVELSLSLAMNLVAEDRITGLLALRSRVEGGAAGMLASFGMQDCRVRVQYEIRHVGP
jgi:hypothetical protein